MNLRSFALMPIEAGSMAFDITATLAIILHLQADAMETGL